MIYVYGHSDDCVEVEGHESMLNEFYGPTALEFGDTDFGGVRVEMTYTGPGLWAATIRQLEENVPIPWDIQIRHTWCSARENVPGYSVMVIIDIPNPVAIEMTPFSLEGLDDEDV